MALFVAVAVPILVAVIAASVSLYVKRLDRQNAGELRHSEAREKAYDQILASGDAAWYYRTEQDKEHSSWEEMAGIAVAMFEASMDSLEQHSSDFNKIEPILIEWFSYAFDTSGAVPRQVENARSAVVDLRRRETGLRKRLNRVSELSFLDRVSTGHVVQRQPEGINNVIHFEDGSYAIIGAGDEFNQVFDDFINQHAAHRRSRGDACRRLAEWRKKGVWTTPSTDRERQHPLG